MKIVVFAALFAITVVLGGCSKNNGNSDAGGGGKDKPACNCLPQTASEVLLTLHPWCTDININQEKRQERVVFSDDHHFQAEGYLLNADGSQGTLWFSIHGEWKISDTVLTTSTDENPNVTETATIDSKSTTDSIFFVSAKGETTEFHTCK